MQRFVIWSGGEPEQTTAGAGPWWGRRMRLWWSAHACELSRHYYVIAPDLSGHGDSGRREELPDRNVGRGNHGSRRGCRCRKGPGSCWPQHGRTRKHGRGPALYGAERLAGAIIVDSPVRRPDPESIEGKRRHGLSPAQDRIPTSRPPVAHFRLIPEQPCENRFILDHIARHSRS